MTAVDLPNLYADCAPGVAPSTLAAIIQTESAYYPWSININGGQKLRRQPRDRAEATAWAHYLLEHGFNADFGWMQINSGNLAGLGLTAESVFEPCLNIAAGARIITEAYQRATQRFGTDNPMALLAALSIYNTNDPSRGIRNGYVAKVQAAASTPMLVPPIETTLLSPQPRLQAAPEAPVRHVRPTVAARPDPFHAGTAVDSFDRPDGPSPWFQAAPSPDTDKVKP